MRDRCPARGYRRGAAFRPGSARPPALSAERGRVDFPGARIRPCARNTLCRGLLRDGCRNPRIAPPQAGRLSCLNDITVDKSVGKLSHKMLKPCELRYL